MARKGKATHVGNGEEDSQAQNGKDPSKASLAQRARRDRERILKQSIARRSEQHLPGDTSVQPLRDSNIAVHVHKEIQRLEAMARKGKATYVCNGNENSQVQPLRDSNIAVHVHEEIQRLEAMARKGKATYVCSGKENSQVTRGNMISKATLAQRARRDRERIQLGQRSQIDQTRECSGPIPHVKSPSITPNRHPLNCFEQGSNVTQSAKKRQRVAQTSMSPSFMLNTSSPPHMNRPTLTDQVELCCEDGLDDEVEVPMNLEGPSRAHINLGRHYLGKMDIECTNCKALHWMDERLTKSPRSRPLFGTCCLQRKVQLEDISMECLSCMHHSVES